MCKTLSIILFLDSWAIDQTKCKVQTCNKFGFSWDVGIQHLTNNHGCEVPLLKLVRHVAWILNHDSSSSSSSRLLNVCNKLARL